LGQRWGTIAKHGKLGPRSGFQVYDRPQKTSRRRASCNSLSSGEDSGDLSRIDGYTSGTRPNKDENNEKLRGERRWGTRWIDNDACEKRSLGVGGSHSTESGAISTRTVSSEMFSTYKSQLPSSETKGLFGPATRNRELPRIRGPVARKNLLVFQSRIVELGVVGTRRPERRKDGTEKKSWRIGQMYRDLTRMDEEFSLRKI